MSHGGHDRQDVQGQMAVGKMAHRVLLRIPQRVEGRLPRIERLGETVRHVHIAGHHHDPALIGVRVLVVIPVVVVKPQRQGNSQDCQQQEDLGRFSGLTFVFLG